MIFGELIDNIEFEAGIDKKVKTGNFTESLIKEILDSYTSITKYDELYISDRIIYFNSPDPWDTLATYNAGDRVEHNGFNWISQSTNSGVEPTASSSFAWLVEDYSVSLPNINLPPTIQHLDDEKIRYRFAGEINTQRRLLRRKSLGIDDGITLYFVKHGENLLKIWPYSDSATTDQLVINYWTKGSAALTSLESVFTPDVLLQTVRSEATARMKMLIGDKMASSFFSNARKMHSRSYGSTDLNDSNGR